MFSLRGLQRLRLTQAHLNKPTIHTAQPFRRLATMAGTTNPKNYKFNHSMIRVKDPKASIKFYELLGMTVIKTIRQPEAKFDLYFLAYDSPKAVSAGASVFDREGLIELTHNYGTEDDASYTVNNGNTGPHRGFGHLCIAVDNIQAACDRIEKAGYEFQKKLSEGRMRHIAFVKDADGYWVELITWNDVAATEGVAETDVSTYRMNHTMLRVKDADKSLAFYRDVLGMNLLRKNESSSFTLFFLGYNKDGDGTATREGVLELTWNHGTEKEADFKYHNGNDQPQGFGHICVTVDDIDAACERFESLNCNWKKRLTDGRMKNVAFLLDPDNYWIEVVQNEKFTGKDNF
ncbi:Lactoylglutathione lyase like protein [Verticillium longisporum]|uniref:Lactoylglutathione lyase n=1 Tax=Verticillium longisporum TaxID=100787 RepID=A0A8I3AMH6_VERLO|nr:Lactoylglutathione lyase like protein [Verticillium longisporum]